MCERTEPVNPSVDFGAPNRVVKATPCWQQLAKSTRKFRDSEYKTAAKHSLLSASSAGTGLTFRIIPGVSVTQLRVSLHCSKTGKGRFLEGKGAFKSNMSRQAYCARRSITQLIYLICPIHQEWNIGETSLIIWRESFAHCQSSATWRGPLATLYRNGVFFAGFCVMCVNE